jgi:hypothetical protein
MPVKVSIESAADSLARDRRSVSKAIREAGLQPSYADGRVAKFDLSQVIKALREHDSRIGYCTGNGYAGGNPALVAVADELERQWSELEDLRDALLSEASGERRCSLLTDRVAPALRQYRESLTRSASLLPTAEGRVMAGIVSNTLYADAYSLIEDACMAADERHHQREGDTDGVEATAAAG